MKDSELDTLVRSLPREVAGPGFAAKVEARLRAPRELRRTTLWLGGAAAVAALALVVVTVVGWHKTRESSTRLARDASALHADIDRLAASLEHPETTSRLIYVGGDDRLDLAIDAPRLAEHAAPVHLDARPIAYGGHEL